MTRLVSGMLALSAWLGAAAAAAPGPEAGDRLQQAALTDATAWRLLESLTVEIGPRMAGSAADAAAVDWAVTNLHRLGFDRVWREEVRFPRWLRRHESARIVAPREQPMAVTALGGSPATGGALRAEVVRFQDLAALEALDPGALQGKIAFLSRRMERSQAGSGYGVAVEGRSRGPFVAAAKGALALIIRSVGTDNDRLPHTGMISTSLAGAPVPAAAISNPDADLLERLLQRGQRVELELDLDCGFAGEAVSANVIGEFDGREPDGGFVVVGGHLDSWDLGTGAIDNGTGVAITMAAAHLVYSGGTRPRRGTRVVLFANEEQGVYGGKAYAAAHSGDLAAHVLGAESDLGSGRIYRMTARVLPSALSAVSELEARLAPLGIPWDRQEQAGGGADLGEMRKIGLPVVDLSHDASRYFDLHHTANDTLDKVAPADLAFNVAAYVTLIHWAAEATADFGPVPASD